MVSAIAPRPIAFVSSMDKDGKPNLAPFSFFNAFGEKPHYVAFASAGPKDSLLNVEETGEFVCSLATWDLRFNMNMTAAPVPRGVDEFPIGDLIAASSRLVKPPRVKQSPAAFECKYWKTIELPPAEPGGKSTYVAVDEAKSKQIMRLLESLDDHDDTQNVYSNFDIPAEMMETA